MGNDLNYQEHRPLPQLREFVQCFWEMRAPCDDLTPQLILPDGCMGLILNFGGPLEQVVDERAVRQPRTLFIGELRRPFITRSRGHLELLGVRFWPGAIRVFIDAPAEQAVDGMADGSLLRASLAREVAREVHGADAEERRERLQHALLNQLGDRPRPHRMVRAAVQALLLAEGVVNIDSLAGTLGVSRRHLEREFVREVGVAPKSLASVLRFRRVLRAIEEGAADWAGVALRCGYYDQSHLIRDFKRYTGRSPNIYLREGHPIAALSDGLSDSLR
jgi:AraC-like DNA-binding protein